MAKVDIQLDKLIEIWSIKFNGIYYEVHVDATRDREIEQTFAEKGEVTDEIKTELQTIVSRNTNPLESTVVTIGTINGGYNFNIIADKVSLKGTTRSYTKENRKI